MYLFFNLQCDMDRPICFIVTVLMAFKNRSSAKIKANRTVPWQGSILYLSLRRLFKSYLFLLKRQELQNEKLGIGNMLEGWQYLQSCREILSYSGKPETSIRADKSSWIISAEKVLSVRRQWKFGLKENSNVFSEYLQQKVQCLYFYKHFEIFF